MNYLRQSFRINLTYKSMFTNHVIEKSDEIEFKDMFNDCKTSRSVEISIKV